MGTKAYLNLVKAFTLAGSSFNFSLLVVSHSKKYDIFSTTEKRRLTDEKVDHTTPHQNLLASIATDLASQTSRMS